MKWNSQKKRLLIDSLENSTRKLRIGSRCLYVPLTGDICAKLYKNRMQRNRCVEFQKVAAKNSLAPKVGDVFSIKLFIIDHLHENLNSHNMYNVRSRTMYGYLSEKADLRGVRLSKHKARKLENKLLSIGINHYDIRRCNVGYLNGNLVCIDFDSNSCNKKIKKGQLNHFHKQT